MLAIRMQRTGRKGHAQFRIIVQESRRTPTSGAIVMQLGSYNPHAKTVVLDKEKTSFYLEHGAQPSDSVVRLLQKEAITLPAWVKLAATKSRATRHPEKLRKNQPAKPAEAVAEPAEANVADIAEPAAETEATAATIPEETPEAEAAVADQAASEAEPAEDSAAADDSTPSEDPTDSEIKE